MALMFSRIPQHILQRVWLSRMCCLCFCPLPGGKHQRSNHLSSLLVSFVSFLHQGWDKGSLRDAATRPLIPVSSLPHAMAMVHLMAVDSGHSRSVSMDVWIRSGPWKIATSRPIPQTWLGTEWRRAFMRQMYQIKCVPKEIDLAILQPDPWSESLREETSKVLARGQSAGPSYTTMLPLKLIVLSTILN